MKNIKGILSLTLVIIFLVGCSSTETMTANEFKKSMEKKAFIKVETFDGGVHIQNGGTNYQTLLMMSLLIDAFKKGQLTNEDDPKNDTFKQIVEFIWKRPKDASKALIKIIGIDSDSDSLFEGFKNEKETN